MVKRLRLAVIAEGVDTAGQVTLLRQHGCDELQGYYYGRPLPADELAALLQYYCSRGWAVRRLKACRCHGGSDDDQWAVQY